FFSAWLPSDIYTFSLRDALPLSAGTPPVRTTVYRYGGERRVIAIRPAHGIDALYAPRRTVLDPLLAEAAAEAGAHVRFGVRVARDRKSTRLNSSHVKITYAVFCL